MLHPANPPDRQWSTYEQKKTLICFFSLRGVCGRGSGGVQYEYGELRKVLNLATGVEWNSLSSFIRLFVVQCYYGKVWSNSWAKVCAASSHAVKPESSAAAGWGVVPAGLLTVYSQWCLPQSSGRVPTIDDYNTVCHWLDTALPHKHTHTHCRSHTCDTTTAGKEEGLCWSGLCPLTPSPLQQPSLLLLLHPPTPSGGSSFTKPPPNTKKLRNATAFCELLNPLKSKHSPSHSLSPLQTSSHPSYLSHLSPLVQGESWIIAGSIMGQVSQGQWNKSVFHIVYFHFWYGTPRPACGGHMCMIRAVSLLNMHWSL